MTKLYTILMPAPGYYKGDNSIHVHVGIVSACIGIIIGLILILALVFKKDGSFHKDI